MVKKKFNGTEYSLVMKSASPRLAKSEVKRRRDDGKAVRTVKRTQKGAGNVVDIYQRSTKTLWKRKK